jgi:DNA-binding HxlR family transcriptional regulator
MKKNIEELTSCPMRRSMEMIGGKWTLSIVYMLLKSGTLRFKELERSIEGINTRMLVKELKMLEEKGIILRKVYPEVPPKVEYTLTEKGKTLEIICQNFIDWGKKYLD